MHQPPLVFRHMTLKCGDVAWKVCLISYADLSYWLLINDDVEEGH